MQFLINKTNYHTFDIFGLNKLPYRAYFIPFASQGAMDKTEFFNEREKSDKVTFLSGDWDFKYYDKVSALSDNFNSDSEKFDKIKIPSCWSRLGYENPCYINSRYEFKADPPNIPIDIPVGVYRKKIEIVDIDKVYYLTFLGVMAGFDLYVNGSHVGYSEGAHNSHEFDVSKYLKEGTNELLVVVFKWSNGTYLECQDMFRDNGIFRDVYLTKNEQTHIYDFKFAYKKDNATYKATLKTMVKNAEGTEIKATLLYKGEQVAETVAPASETIAFDIENAIEWTAETPNLYTLKIVLIKGGAEIEFIRQAVGFKTINIEKDVFYFNGQPIKLFGVNHHDTHPKTAFCLTVEDIKKDICLMKDFNVNSVRTSHYPPDPIFLAFCDFYGLYVIDEADIETHGIFEAKPHTENKLSNDSAWEKHYLDRAIGMYERDKNHPSITMWSLGNESGGIKNQTACYEELKKHTDIPIHYEAAARHERLFFDVGSQMYTSVDSLIDLVNDKNWDKRWRDAPFFLCEYAHAMGVGPGSLDEYVDLFLSHKGLLGGCIWEWADHAVYHDSGIKYTYGGDHNEKKHDKNFCCDGLFFPDRTPSVSAFCMRSAYRPLRASVADGKLVFKNLNFFTDSKNIKAEWKLLVGGVAVKTEIMNEIIAPQQTKAVSVQIGEYASKDTFISITYTDNKSGKIIADETIEVNAVIENQQSNAVPVRFECIDGKFISMSKKGKIEFSGDGDMTFFGLTGNNFINQNPQESPIKGFVPNIYRAPVDNYMYYNNYCKSFKLNSAITSIAKTFIEKDGSFTVVFNLKVRLGMKITAKINYVYFDDGKVGVTCTYKNKAAFVPFDLPKLGLTFEMPTDYDNIEYFGLGKGENYSDLNAHAAMGNYKEKKADFYTDYIKPQDNGNRSKVRYFSVTNAKAGLTFKAENAPFNFKVQDVTTANLCASKHTEDVIHHNTSIVHVDGFVRGIGSGSCGPDTRKQYKKLLKPKETFTYSFTVEPVLVTKTK